MSPFNSMMIYLLQKLLIQYFFRKKEIAIRINLLQSPIKQQITLLYLVV